MSASSNRANRRRAQRAIAKFRGDPVDMAKFHRDQDASRAALRTATVKWAALSLSDRCEGLAVTSVQATNRHGVPVAVTVSMTMQPINPGEPTQ